MTAPRYPKPCKCGACSIPAPRQVVYSVPPMLRVVLFGEASVRHTLTECGPLRVAEAKS